MLTDPDARFHLFIGGSRRIVNVVDRGRLALDALRPANAMIVPSVGSAVSFPSRGRRLEGWLVEPPYGSKAVLLIFHGIGDCMHYWRRAQAMLQANGFTSLVFDYAGYGGSEGDTTPGNLEADGQAAYHWLQARNFAELPTFVLGFSMGTGLLTEIAAHLRPQPQGVILCQAYTSFRHATERVVSPFTLLARLMPDVWRTSENLATFTQPLLIVHGENDRLFPAAMARSLYEAAERSRLDVQLAVVPGHSHNAVYRLVPVEYWSPVLTFMHKNGAG